MTPPNRRLDVFVGMLILAMCHMLAAGIGYVVYFVGLQLGPDSIVAFILFPSLFAIGLTQLIYVIPLCLWLRKRRQYDTMKGVIIGAVITALLNGSCFLYVLHMLNHMHY